jgi:hypothetical protein
MSCTKPQFPYQSAHNEPVVYPNRISELDSCVKSQKYRQRASNSSDDGRCVHLRCLRRAQVRPRRHGDGLVENSGGRHAGDSHEQYAACRLSRRVYSMLGQLEGSTNHPRDHVAGVATPVDMFVMVDWEENCSPAG